MHQSRASTYVDGEADPSDPRDVFPSIGELLRVIGGGATGSVLIALGEGPLRTKELIGRVPHYAPRTIYRCTDKLIALGLVDRDERDCVPSIVTYSLTAERGVDLHRLLDTCATAWLTGDGADRLTAGTWASLTMLAELWDLGVVDALSRGGRSVTELSRRDHGLTFHQINRRTNNLVAGGLLSKQRVDRTTKHFELTPRARRGMPLVAAVGRWRGRHLGDGALDLAPAEMATILRAVLPLVRLPPSEPARLILAIGNGTSGDHVTVGATVDPEGRIAPADGAADSIAAWAHGSVAAWLEALLEGSPVRINHGADPMIEALLARLHGAYR